VLWRKLTRGPQAFLPLVNQPLLEYTLELLAVSGVHDVIIFCCYHADQIKDYIRCAWLVVPRL